ncbi:unnamed protein product, partial [Brenthis ino]
MSVSYNEARRTNKLVGRNAKQAQRIEEFNDEKNSSEDDFRGFEKMPLVLCERFDISPYLSTTKSNTRKIKDPLPLNQKEMNCAPNKSKQIELNKILHECSVILVREDLEQLKEMVKNKSPILNGDTGLKCKICDKEYSSDKKLQNHIENKHIIYKSPNKTPKRVSFSDHIIVHEVKEYHRCRKCPKIFENYNTLKLHMKQKHRKRKCYICHYCSKDFVDRTFFKVHIKLHCDACGLLLFNKKNYLEHRRQVCRVIKKYECKTCHMLFFNFMDLKDHSYYHLGTFFICDICKDQFETKCAVAHHIQFLHSNKRPESLYVKQSIGIEKVYVCNFCEESAMEESMIEDHVSSLPDLQNRAMTGYKDYYFCDQCLKMFSTETDMLQHKWTHFLRNDDSVEQKANENSIKTTYKIGEKLPDILQPKLILKKVEVPKVLQVPQVEAKPVNPIIQTYNPQVCSSSLPEKLKRAIVDPISKKTIISKYQCENCGKYLSSNYCLNRHMRAMHGIHQEENHEDDSRLQCPICEEIFVWPSLLKSHNCIRMSLPEMPFDDARSEIQFDNMNGHSFDNLDIIDDDDYMNSVDFEIPAPIVELREYDNVNIVLNSSNNQINVINNHKVNHLGLKVMLQEVPIEF